MDPEIYELAEFDPIVRACVERKQTMHLTDEEALIEMVERLVAMNRNLRRQLEAMNGR